MARSSCRKTGNQKIGIERIKRLFALADSSFKKNPELSDRYVQLARKIGMRYNIRIPRELKRKICAKCHKYMVPGVSCTIRIKSGQKNIKCLACGAVMRYPHAGRKRK